ncbi:MAG: cytochrome c-type biogenesis protein CcmH [Gammaproteobacteria bacterium]|nr:cytochrome c-type biogenesis protein CcmH [Gammaproteobacteria bacterium]
MNRRAGLTMVLAIATCLGASAIDGFDFPDPETAERYQRLITDFRCPKCLNESIASSGAPIAVDLRRTVRRLMEEGATNDAIRDHLQERYGDFVLYDPPFKPSTWLLWFSPVVLLVVGIYVLIRVARRSAASDTASDDLDRARRLLRDTT